MKNIFRINGNAKPLSKSKGYIFSKENGEQFTGDYFSKQFKEACRAAGMDEGIHFQIPVYLLAYRARNPELRCAGAYSYMFNEGKIAKGIFTEKLFARNRPMTEAEFANLLDKTRNKVMQLLLGIYSGDFFLNPHDVSKRCQHGKCPYYELCRIDSGTVENNGNSDD